MRIASIAGAMLLTLVSVAHAKVADPAPVQARGVVYRSHANYVEARLKKRDAVVWKQEVFAADAGPVANAQLEGDVQWRRINSIAIEGNRIRVGTTHGEVFYLDRRTGKLLPEQPVQP